MVNVMKPKLLRNLNLSQSAILKSFKVLRVIKANQGLYVQMYMIFLTMMT